MLRMTITGDGLDRMGYAAAILGEKVLPPLNRAVNQAGEAGRTQVRQNLPKQTGLPRKTILKALRETRSNYGTLSYRIESTGGDIALKYFQAKEKRRGVVASPFGKKQTFEGRFMKAGRFPGRVNAPALQGHVFRPIGGGSNWGRPIDLEKSGVIIPAEMVKGATADAWTAVVRTKLPERVAHELGRATKGAVT